MKILTQEQVRATIAILPTIDTETLSHSYKVYHCSTNKLVQIAAKPLLDAILKELRSRTKPLADTTLGLDKKSKEQTDDDSQTDI